MKFFQNLHQRSYAKKRKFDIDVLWPAIRRKARSREYARKAFMLHASIDPAWKSLSDVEVDKIIDDLP